MKATEKRLVEKNKAIASVNLKQSPRALCASEAPLLNKFGNLSSQDILVVT